MNLSHLESLRVRVEELSFTPSALDAVTSLLDLAAALDALRTARKTLADMEKAVEARLAAQMPEKAMTIGGFALEARGGSKRKWDIPAALEALSAEAVDPSTGEVWTAISTKVLRDVAGIGYLRTSGLEAHGFDPDRFSEWEESRPSVTLKRVEEAS